MATVDTLLTAEEFARLPDNGRPTELVRGKVVHMNLPSSWHGYVCCNVAGLLRNFVVAGDLGRVLTNDAGIITERDPDTVRGADVSYYSYQRVPKASPPKKGYWPAPELVIEVRSPTDRWRDILTKVAEYLGAGVLVVCVVDPDTETVTVYNDDHPHQVLGKDDVWTVPQVLPGFDVPVARLFE